MMIRLNNNRIRAVFTDIDGVWTDGGMYYGQDGEAFKKFNTSDSAGVLFLRRLDIPLIVITGEDSEPVKRRMEKLEIELLFSGVKDKLKTAEDFCRNRGISLSSEVAFIGNDINDLGLLNAVAHSAVPADSPKYVKRKADIVLLKKSGAGVFREYIEFIIGQNMDMNKFIKGMIK